jgi:hypothetical protein
MSRLHFEFNGLQIPATGRYRKKATDLFQCVVRDLLTVGQHFAECPSTNGKQDGDARNLAGIPNSYHVLMMVYGKLQLEMGIEPNFYC